MAAAPGTTAHAVERLLALQAAPERYSFFAALRLLDCLHPNAPRIGEAAKPADEGVRLGQVPSLAFAPSTVAAFEPGAERRPGYLATYFFGLFGPNGPLPLHLTEYAHSRELNNGDPTFRRFADVFHHRLLSLFYRAWAAGQPAVSLDRAGPRFDAYVGSLLGIAAPEFRNRDAVADEAKLGRAGRYALATRPAEGLVGVLADFFALPFGVRQFVGEWLNLPRHDRLLLGVAEETAALGRNAVLGASVWSCQHCFQIVCGPLRFAEFNRLLPERRSAAPRRDGPERTSLAKLRDLVRNYLGDEYKWTVNLVLERDEVPEWRLGAAGELGWTTWLGGRAAAADADEVVIDPYFTVKNDN
jgi:type VI secretion system protein ImpH